MPGLAMFAGRSAGRSPGKMRYVSATVIGSIAIIEQAIAYRAWADELLANRRSIAAKTAMRAPSQSECTSVHPMRIAMSGETEIGRLISHRPFPLYLRPLRSHLHYRAGCGSREALPEWRASRRAPRQLTCQMPADILRGLRRAVHVRFALRIAQKDALGQHDLHELEDRRVAGAAVQVIMDLSNRGRSQGPERLKNFEFCFGGFNGFFRQVDLRIKITYLRCVS